MRLMTAQQSIGWIGTGRMGHAMATRLLASGQDVQVWNRTPAKAAALAARGATVVPTVSDLAGRDVVFTMVADDAGLVEVTLAEGGLLRQEKVPAYLVECSTVSQETSARIRRVAAERGTTLLAAPVSGN